MKIKLFFFIVFFSLLLELITSPLRGYRPLEEYGIPVSLRFCSVVAFVLYFIFINLILIKYASKLKPQWILIASFMGCCIIQLPFRLFSFGSTLVSLPDFLFHLFSIFLGYLFYISSKYIKSGIVIVSLLCCIFLYFKGYNLWFHRLNFDTFSGIVQDKAEIPVFQFTDKDGKVITNRDFVGKYTILDFWNTSCGVCFQKFPIFEEQYMKYQSNSNIALYAVNVKLPRDEEGVSFKIFFKKRYSFPTLQGGQIEDAKRIFGITAYPAVIVLNPVGVMVFRGDMEKAFSLVEMELKK